MRYIAILAILFLSGCSLFSKGGEDLACPEVGFLSYADTLPLSNAQAVLNGFTGSCSFNKKTDETIVELSLPFVAKKETAAAPLTDIELPYFIAVLSTDEAILQRQAFSTTVHFDNAGAGQVTEEQVIRIPASSLAGAYKYKIVIGFILTPDQLKQNKDNK